MEKIVLFSNETTEEREFDLKHAERILKHQNERNISPSQGWVVPEKSNYEFVDGKLINRTNKGKDSKTAKEE